MAKVTYKPSEGEPTTHTQYGITWGPKAIEVADEAVLARVRNNRFYLVEGGSPKAAAGDDGLKATHNGGGRFTIVYGDSDDDVLKGLDKAEADAFNALSDEGKAAYVEAHKTP